MFCHFRSSKWRQTALFVRYVKVKCTNVQALRLCTGRTANRWSRGIALPFHDHGNRRGWGARVTPRPLFSPGKDPVPIVQEAGWAQGRSGQVRKFSPPTGIRSPNCPARRQSLYRLSYRAHCQVRTEAEKGIFFNNLDDLCSMAWYLTFRHRASCT